MYNKRWYLYFQSKTFKYCSCSLIIISQKKILFFLFHFSQWFRAMSVLSHCISPTTISKNVVKKMCFSFVSFTINNSADLEWISVVFCQCFYFFRSFHFEIWIRIKNIAFNFHFFFSHVFLYWIWLLNARRSYNTTRAKNTTYTHIDKLIFK